MLERFAHQGSLLTRATSLVVAAVILTSAVLSTQASAAPTVLNLGQSVGLDTLVSGGGIRVGDKIFSDFSIDGQVSAEEVSVVAIQDSYGYGISFQGAFASLGFGSIDFRLGFAVEVAPDSSQYISDVHLGIVAAVNGFGFAQVVEQVFDNGANPLGNLMGQIEAYTPPNNLSATYGLDTPAKKLYIQKDILLAGGGCVKDHRRLVTDYTSVYITEINQTFSQVPEPSTVLLVTLGLFGVAATARRRS